MLRTSFTILVCLFCASGLSLAQDPTPSFSLTLEAPPEISGPGGTSVVYAARGRLTTSGLTESQLGAQGWSISLGAEGGTITGITTAGTDVEALFSGGFNKTELTAGPGNEGAVSAVVLSLTEPIQLPPTGSADIIQVSVTAVVPNAVIDEEGEPTCVPLQSRVFFVDGKKGSGQPVDNKVTWNGNTFLPSLGEGSTTICPIVQRSFSLSVDLEGGSRGGALGPSVPWFRSVPVGSGLTPVELSVVLASSAPGSGGAQGWSMSILTEPCFAIGSATTDGTDVDLYYVGGFKKTEIVDPSRNGGRSGIVSAVVLSLTEPRRLPEVGQAALLRVLGTMDASSISAGGETTGPCGVRLLDPTETGLRGSGQPVKTAVTVQGQTRTPGSSPSILRLVGATEGLFVRGDANDDGKNNIADAVWIVNEVFRGGPATPCRDAADANNDSLVDLSDALYIIGYQFQGQSAPPAPFPGCGADPEGADDGLECTTGQTSCP